MSNEEMTMELRMALTSLSMALARVQSEDDRKAAQYELFESVPGIVALDQLESVLGLVLGDREDVVRKFELGPLTLELTHVSDGVFVVDESRINELEMWRGPRP